MYIMTIAMQTMYLLTCSVSDMIYWRKIKYYYYYYYYYYSAFSFALSVEEDDSCNSFPNVSFVLVEGCD